MNVTAISSLADLSTEQWLALGNSLGGVEEVKKRLGEISPASTKVLQPMTPFSVEVEASDVLEFYNPKTPMLNMAWTFQKYILDNIKSSDMKHSRTTLGYVDLPVRKTFSDGEVCDEFPEGYIFEDTFMFLACLKKLFPYQRQSLFMPGLPELPSALLPLVYRPNIFHVRGVEEKVYGVDVSWQPHIESWNLEANDLNDLKGSWRQGVCRFFSAKI